MQLEANAYSGCGAKWINLNTLAQKKKPVKADCKTAAEIIHQLNKNSGAPLIINLTGKEYHFRSPLNIANDLLLTTSQKSAIKFSTDAATSAFFIQVKAGKSLILNNLKLDFTEASVTTFITTDTSGSSNHSSFSMSHCNFENLNGNFFTAAKSSVSDSILITNCSFSNGNGALFSFPSETDKKGYYNTETIRITNTSIQNYTGPMLTLLRTGNDESTMGPKLLFANNKIQHCLTRNEEALIHIYGVQHSVFEKNIFQNSNYGKTLVHFEDAVRASHLFRNNTLLQSGVVIEDKFVRSENNTIN